jgi:hypothetical protein
MAPRALALLWERRHHCPDAVPAVACQDETVVECDATHAESAAAWLRQATLDGMAPLIAPVPVLGEARVGPIWA